MKPKDFLSKIDDRQIVNAINEAEKKSSGEIRVFVSRLEVLDAVSSAKDHFQKLKMENTKERNAVLIFIAPQNRKFAIIGDTAIHEKCGQQLWDSIASATSDHFKKGQYTQALVQAVKTVGAQLAIHFPRRDDDQNELPNEVAHD